jgi:hypothetical protein
LAVTFTRFCNALHRFILGIVHHLNLS